MTVVPLPDTPCVRCSCVFNKGAPGEGSVRFFLSYSGSAPSGANCTTLATDVAAAWASNLSPLINTGSALEEVDVIDIATHAGASGTANVADAGTRSGTALPVQVCTNVEYDIARRYRGGKPRGFYPFGVESDLLDQAHWQSGFLTGVNTDLAAFFAAIAALSIGSMGTLAHVNLSYFQGFTNHTNTSGRSRAVPTYRATALHDNVVGYAAKSVLGSQRRRRTATTP